MTDDLIPAESLLPDSPSPPTFHEAVTTGVERLRSAIAEFESLIERIPEDAYSEGEARVLEAAAAEIEVLIEAGHLDFESAAYDGAAWYQIVESLQRTASKLYDAVFLLRDIERRVANDG